MRLFLVLITIAGCSSGSAPCAMICGGCCDAMGVCQAGDTNTACGKGGATCSACTCSAQVCQGGAGGGTSGAGGGTSGAGGGTSGTGGGTSNPSCPSTPIEAANMTGGCTMFLVAPNNCATLNFSSGNNFEFDWSTNTTFCEGPHHLLVGGSPVSTWMNGGTNFIDFSISSGMRTESGMTRNIGGYAFLNSASLQGITSDNGVYYFRIQSFYGSSSETRAFIRQ